MATGAGRKRKLAPSVHVRGELNNLLVEGVERDENLVRTLAELLARFVVQRLLEADQADFLGQRGRYRRRQTVQRGSRNGYEPGWLRTPAGSIKIRIPQVRNSTEPFRPGLLITMRRDPTVLDRVVIRTFAQALSSRGAEEDIRDTNGVPLISGAALAEAAYELSEDYQVFISRDLSDVPVKHLYCDALFRPGPASEEEQAVLIAWSVDSEGRQRPLHLAVDNKESEDTWTSVFWNLVDRHMPQPATVMCGGSRAITKAAEMAFPNSVLLRGWIERQTERWTGTA